MIRLLPALVAFVVGVLPLEAAEGVTLKQGSAERQAICDGARTHVVKEYVTAKLPQPLVFKIQRLQVLGDSCSFEALPLFKDGRPIGTGYVMDIVFNFCLQRKAGRWQVVTDLSSTDVPSGPELKTIRQRIPPDYPMELLSPFWQDLFRRAGR